jgi:hypothetical protein
MTLDSDVARYYDRFHRERDARAATRVSASAIHPRRLHRAPPLLSAGEPSATDRLRATDLGTK